MNGLRLCASACVCQLVSFAKALRLLFAVISLV